MVNPYEKWTNVQLFTIVRDWKEIPIHFLDEVTIYTGKKEYVKDTDWQVYEKDVRVNWIIVDIKREYTMSTVRLITEGWVEEFRLYDIEGNTYLSWEFADVIIAERLSKINIKKAEELKNKALELQKEMEEVLKEAQSISNK